jgi:hypothetical protein
MPTEQEVSENFVSPEDYFALSAVVASSALLLRKKRSSSLTG